MKFGFYQKELVHFKTNQKSVGFAAPVYVKQLDEANEKGENKVAITARNVRIRTKPNQAAQILATVSYGLFIPIFDQDFRVVSATSSNGVEWVKLKLETGEIGFVAKQFTSEYLYSTLEVIFDEWRMENNRVLWGYKILVNNETKYKIHTGCDRVDVLWGILPFL